MTADALVGGTLVDGTGAPALRGDILLRDGVIAEVGDIGPLPPQTRVHDVSNRWVAPGWIDVHSHGDDSPLFPDHDGSKVLQGITSEVVGNCGFSLAPRTPEHQDTLNEHLERIFSPVSWDGSSFGDLLKVTDGRGYVTNYAPLIGHGTLRVAVAGFRPGPLTAPELRAMLELTSDAMAAGAVGVSSGLIYPPGAFADTDELVAVATVVREAGGIYASHVRAEGRGRMTAIREAIEIGRRSGVRVQVSHHKAKGPEQWGTIENSVAAAESARAEGIEIGFDAYPYDASATTLAACLPPDLFALDDLSLLAELARPQIIDRLRTELADTGWDNHVHDSGGYQGILVSNTADGRFEGQTLAQLADRRGTDGAEALVHVLREERLRAGMVAFAMTDADVQTALRATYTAIGSDSAAAGSGRLGHPRARGTFARVLGRYSRDLGLFGLEEAVHRMTGLPADWFRLQGVGRLQRGYAADVVVFDPATIADRATYADPDRYPVGIDEVFVSGRHVVQAGVFTGATAGRRLRLGRTAALAAGDPAGR
ncbi:N-acyl-D-amino-acid deacylase family protein [Nakamurella lactea]|uniref:N-acyl-D-amino-acid deacylase family protein n=1 Tax=Nakamurella lactea TaxID=459515 RepID=UPI0004080801|nr:D-aminoacylase [Nakamurella lactea]